MAAIRAAFRLSQRRAACLPHRRASGLTGKPVREIFPPQVFVERVRRGDRMIEADADTVLEPATSSDLGRRDYLVEQVESSSRGRGSGVAGHAAELVDVFVQSKAVNGRTRAAARRRTVHAWHLVRKITRNLVELPVLPEMEILRGDVLTLGGSQRHMAAAVKAIGHADARRGHRPCSGCRGILIGGLIGALSITVAECRSACPPPAARCWPAAARYFRHSSHVWQHPRPGSLADEYARLNVSSRSSDHCWRRLHLCLQQVGISLFLWGIVATSVPLIIAVLLVTSCSSSTRDSVRRLCRRANHDGGARPDPG